MKVLSFEASLVKYTKFFKVSLSGLHATFLFGDYLRAVSSYESKIRGNWLHQTYDEIIDFC